MKRLSVQDGFVGKGLFTTVPRVQGECIIEYIGEKIPTPVADARPSRYLFDLENGWTLDGETEGNMARYVNHSCSPNCEAALENERIFFYAARDIASGEEITIDYGPEYFDEFIKPFGCLCPRCKREPLA